MNAKFLTAALIAVAGFAAAPSFAGQFLRGEAGNFAPDAPSTSTLTREEVRNEVVQAARNGTLPGTGEGADVGQVAKAGGASALTRAQVREELAQAIRSGTMPITGEGSDLGNYAAAADHSTLTRAEVRAQTADAAQHGRISYGEL